MKKLNNLHIDNTKIIKLNDIMPEIKKLVPDIDRKSAVLVGGTHVFWGENRSLILIKECGRIALPQNFIQLDKEIREVGSFPGGVKGYLFFSRTCKELVAIVNQYAYIHLLPYGLKATTAPNYITGGKSCLAE